MKVGMASILYLDERPGLSSTLTRMILSLPAYSEASSSTIGCIRLQGPHHTAQKSTSTGRSELSTSFWKRGSDVSRTWLTAANPGSAANEPLTSAAGCPSTGGELRPEVE